MRVNAFAKINLHLRVGRKQKDGYHPVKTWMVTVGLFDKLDFSLDSAGRVKLICSDSSLPTDESNLVIRAIRVLQKNILKNEVGQNQFTASHGARVSLTKQIPTGGGLGGGSSDAAATLMALNELWKLKIPRQQLTELAAEIGSDVAFFTQGPSSICTGRGQLIEPIAPPKPKWVTLILPGISVPTPPVFRQFDQMEDSRTASGQCDWDQEVDWKHWLTLSAAELLPLLRNDLELPAFALFPELGKLRFEAEQVLSRPVRMSGSGSSLFTLFDREDEAIAVREKIQSLSKAAKIVAAHVAPEEVIG